MGGATPTIVPFSLLGGPAAPAAPGTADPGRGSPPTGGGGAGTGCAAGAGAGVAAPGWFIISMVPLNFGAAAPLTLKLHFEHVAAASGF